MFGQLTKEEAVRACGFTAEQLPLSTLRYHVGKRQDEEARKRKLQDQQEGDKENNSTSASTLIVAYGASNNVSPLSSLSETSSWLTGSGASVASSSTSRGKARLSSWQASVVHLQAKEEKQIYDVRFKAAFKEASHKPVGSTLECRAGDSDDCLVERAI